jgi:hypothetical protein
VECSLQDAAARPELCSFVASQSPAPAAPFRSRVKSQDHVRTVRCWLLGFRERKYLPSAVNALRHAMPCHAMSTPIPRPAPRIWAGIALESTLQL